MLSSMCAENKKRNKNIFGKGVKGQNPKPQRNQPT